MIAELKILSRCDLYPFTQVHRSNFTSSKTPAGFFIKRANKVAVYMYSGLQHHLTRTVVVDTENKNKVLLTFVWLQLQPWQIRMESKSDVLHVKEPVIDKVSCNNQNARDSKTALIY